jgi:hypothetical protein
VPLRERVDNDLPCNLLAFELPTLGHDSLPDDCLLCWGEEFIATRRRQVDHDDVEDKGDPDRDGPFHDEDPFPSVDLGLVGNLSQPVRQSVRKRGDDESALDEVRQPELAVSEKFTMPSGV